MFSVRPIQLIIFAFTLYLCYSFWNQSWFSYHPMFMIFGYLGCMSNAVFFERWGVNHWIHMFLQIICALCVDFAWYVIYTNKNMAKKNHNTTWHSWVGVGCLVLNNLQCMGAIYNLWPGKAKKDKKPLDITLHKWSGRIMFTAILIAMHLGFYKLKRSKMIKVILFDAFLVSVAIATLTKWIYIKPLWKEIRI